MWFNIVTYNHGGRLGVEGLSGITNYMRGALSKCGHEVTVVFNEVFKGAINLIIERFEDPTLINEILRTQWDNSLKMGIVATELMIDGEIPYAKHGIKYLGGEGSTFLQQRIVGFEAMARRVDFLWSFLERTAAAQKHLCPVSEMFPVGYVTEIPAEIRRSPKDVDVLFFGQSTPHRSAVIDGLGAIGIRGVIGGPGFNVGFVPNNLLSSLLDRAKIGLNLTLHARDDSVKGIDPRFASCLRVKQMLDHELCIVSEEIPLDNPYRQFMISAEPGDLPAVCAELLKSGEWQPRGKAMAAAYREKMDVTNLCTPVIERTIKAIGAVGT